MYERFTDRARKVMQLANTHAKRFKHYYIDTEHILLGLVEEGSGVAANVFKNLDIEQQKIPPEVEKHLQAVDRVSSESTGRLPQTPRTKKVIDYAIEEARNLNHNYVGTEHILLGLLREEEGLAAQVLTSLGLKIQAVREEVRNLLGHTLPDEKSQQLPEPSSPSNDPRVRELDREIERLDTEKEQAIMDQDFDKAAGFRDLVVELKRRRTELFITEHKIPKELRPDTIETYGVSDLTSADLTDPSSLFSTELGDLSDRIRFSLPGSPTPIEQQIDPYSRFTDRSRKVMQLANQEAQRFNHEYIGTEHILLGLVKEGSGVAANVLKNLDIDLRKIRLEVEKIVQHGPGGEQVVMGRLPHTPRAKKVIDYSVEEARNLNHNYVGTEHLLLGLLREQEGVAAQVLMNLGLKLEDVREEVLNLLGHGTHSSESAKDSPAGTANTSPDSATSEAGIAPEPLAVYEIDLIKERIRFLQGQQEACIAAQDLVRAEQRAIEAEALKKLLNVYFWYLTHPS